MKKKIATPLKIAFLIVFAQLLGCHKFIDVKDLWHHHNPDCRIEKITYSQGLGTDTITASFHYNNKGNPVRIHFNNVTYPPDYFFYYDHKDRLIDYFGMFANNAYFFWYHYKYDNKGRVIADTLNGFGQVINGKPIPSSDEFKYHSVYEYDASDRVKNILTTRVLETVIISDSFTYNAAGNLVHYKNVIRTSSFPSIREERYESHDNKVSFLRTNRLWLFLSRNYSRNNLERADAYNSSGLPVRFDIPGFMDFRFIGDFQMRQAKIEYRCK